MAFPTRLQVKQRFLQLLDDPAGVVFTDTPGPGGAPSLFQAGFSEAYDIIFNAFLNQQVPRVESVVSGIVVPPGTTSLTPAAMGISDFSDWDWIAERLYGSNDKFIDLVDRDRLSQRAMTDKLIETVWQNNAFQFLGATTVRELQMKYVSSGEAPTADATEIGIDSSLVFLSNYAAGVSGGKKGYEELAQRCLLRAVGPKFDLGTIGGELFRLTQPLVRSRQNVQVAHRPYSVQRRLSGGRRGVPYVASQAGTTGGGSMNSPIQFSSLNGTITGTIDGSNLSFFLVTGAIASLSLFKNGVLLTSGVDYVSVNNMITFIPASVPRTGDALTAEAFPIYQV